MRPRRHHVFRVRPLTEKERGYISIINEGLDAATEFGVEHASREQLLTRVGELTAILRLLRNRIGL